MTDGQAVGLVIIGAMVALCLFAAFEYRHAPLTDAPGIPADIAAMDCYSAAAAVAAPVLVAEVEAFLEDR